MLACNQRAVGRGISKFHASSYAVNLVLRYHRRRVFAPDQAHYVRQAQDFDALNKRQMSEDVPGEERHFQRYTPVFPLAQGPVTGEEMLNFVTRQTLRSLLLLVGSNGQNKPLGIIEVEW